MALNKEQTEYESQKLIQDRLLEKGVVSGLIFNLVCRSGKEHGLFILNRLSAS